MTEVPSRDPEMEEHPDAYLHEKPSWFITKNVTILFRRGIENVDCEGVVDLEKVEKIDLEQIVSEL